MTEVLPNEFSMSEITTSEAAGKLDKLVEQTATEHEPLLLVGPRSSAILVSPEEWRGLQETIYLLSIPGMREKLLEGKNTPLSECTENLDW